jgi:tRNA-specific 2-thiouridylase
MKIAVLASGGVDSSVALRLLQEQGHDVTAFYLKIWLEDELAYLGDCPWEEDLAYVQQICAAHGIPLEVVSLQREYWDRVVSYTIAEVKAGRTPNPDMMCNQRVKFGAFFDKIDASYDKVATGHYAQVEERQGAYWLKQSADPVKDQTYFLSHLSQAQLGRALFPIGHLTKAEVRDLAKRFDLPNQDRKDSQGICFLGKIRYRDFIAHHLGEQAGDLVEKDTGRLLGRHKGYWNFTIGQRHGILLSGGPWYVVGKDMPNNIVYISHDYQAGAAARADFEMEAPNWIPEIPDLAGALDCKLRHGPESVTARITPLPDSRFAVKLDSPDGGIAAGQFAVFYQDGYCRGGGVISEG